MSKAKLISMVLALGLILGLFGVSHVSADGPPLPPTPGIVRGTGTDFEITDSQYLDVVLNSTEVIRLSMSSVPEVVTINLASAEGAVSTELVLSGLDSGATYFFQVNGDPDPPQIYADADGRYSWTQDISQPYNLRIRPEMGTLNLTNTGGGCTAPHNWNPATTTCTLGSDVNSGDVTIQSSNMTLNGGGFVIRNGIFGVSVSNKTGVTLTNLDIRDTPSGVQINAGSTNVTLDHSIITADEGINLFDAHSLEISDNTVTSTVFFSLMFMVTNSEVLRNTISADAQFAVQADGLQNVFFTGNTFSSPVAGVLVSNGIGGNTFVRNAFTDSLRWTRKFGQVVK